MFAMLNFWIGKKLAFDGDVLIGIGDSLSSSSLTLSSLSEPLFRLRDPRLISPPELSEADPSSMFLPLSILLRMPEDPFSYEEMALKVDAVFSFPLNDRSVYDPSELLDDVKSASGLYDLKLRRPRIIGVATSKGRWSGLTLKFCLRSG